MMKIFETQLSGILRKLDGAEMEIEDAARMTAQSILSDGHVYAAASPDLGGIVSQALHGADAVPDCGRLEADTPLSSLDTIWLFTNDVEETRAEMQAAFDSGAALVLVMPKKTGHELEQEASFIIETSVTRPLIPTESGRRIGEPHLLVSLHVYYALYFQLMEILEEHVEG
ncbi:DUF2529 family protein [Alkalicoccus halolimnae]|uniref:DUF2529 family protein n=1 Tax=Alkalicoccus halolimnae TaxID=1667239 RepID=A0A5C7FBW0_9BACI|nr:DUF2529 family protein [Alkalicoccus halolimnae]TXF86930.1 DUF2529 family protein [Alkalicoccus halolimnae]